MSRGLRPSLVLCLLCNTPPHLHHCPFVATPCLQVWAGHGLCKAKIIDVDTAQSTLYPDQDVTVYTVRYDMDGTKEDLEEAEIRALLIVSDQLAASVIPAGLLVVSPAHCSRYPCTQHTAHDAYNCNRVCGPTCLEQNTAG